MPYSRETFPILAAFAFYLDWSSLWFLVASTHPDPTSLLCNSVASGISACVLVSVLLTDLYMLPFQLPSFSAGLS